ncbi:hypothetical protein FRC18_002921 [Serendipita sp. 400]|nr:hypothetical protein FRC18_002921 [Serendipita sp. 400]
MRDRVINSSPSGPAGTTSWEALAADVDELMGVCPPVCQIRKLFRFWIYFGLGMNRHGLYGIFSAAVCRPTHPSPRPFP